MTAPTVLDVARAAYRTGLCVVPPREDGTKRPDGTWKQWQTVRPPADQMRSWFSTGRTGVGILTGSASGGIELFEFDDGDTYTAFVAAARDVGLGELLSRIETGYKELTPGDGVHLLYRCAEVSGNTPLARRPGPPDEHGRPTVHPLIETRGEGGFAVLAPSHGRVHPSGRPYRLVSGGVASIATITPDERAGLWELGRSFDEMPKQEFQPPRDANVTPTSRRLGDDYDARADWPTILEPHGWSRVMSRGGVEYWRKPGKERGWSATINGPGVRPDRLFVFTTATAFEPDRSYGKFAAFAILNHGGDFSAAARDLAQQGYGEPSPTVTFERTDSPSTDATAWPDALDEAAYHGLAGDVVRAVDPFTEADPAGVLASFLAAFGCMIGAGPHWSVSGTDHALRIWPVLVGNTSKGRKGTAHGAIKPILAAADPGWMKYGVTQGLSSGEGLIWAVRDAIIKTEPVKEKGRIVAYEEVTTDPGVTDKRLLVVEQEFASTIRLMGRDGNSLSGVLRQAWDDGDLRSITKNSPARATGAHIVVIGHTTRDELLRYLDNTEAGNGFANRFLWLCVRRAKLLPEGGSLDAGLIRELGESLAERLRRAREIGIIERDAAASTMWREVYRALSDGGVGLMGAVLARAEAQVMRLAGLYAVLDGSRFIRPPHLEAALAVWDYVEASAHYIFGDALGDPVADTILRALRASGPLDRTAISDLFGRHANRARLDRALGLLLESGKARRTVEQTEGRSREVWHAV